MIRAAGADGDVRCGCRIVRPMSAHRVASAELFSFRAAPFDPPASSRALRTALFRPALSRPRCLRPDCSFRAAGAGSPIEGEMTPADLRAVAARSRISRATSN